MCWDKHEKQTDNTPKTGEKSECHTCKQTFKTKNEMMLHRKKQHTDRVKPCREQDNCTRKTCWYTHNNTITIENCIEKEPANIEWVNDELDSEKEDFQLPKSPPSPPLNQ